MAKIKTFVIHLERATGRRAQVAHLLKTTPYHAEILPAVDGAKLSAAEQGAAYSKTPLHTPSYPFALNASEIGCFMSHRAAWQKILDDNLDAALVLEDDVQIDFDAFKPALALAEAQIDILGFIQFQVRDVKGAADLIKEDANMRLVAPAVTPLRTSAQLVSAKAAAHLLECTTPFDRPVDTFLQMDWVTGIKLACAVPSGVSDRTAQTGGSTIPKSTPVYLKLMREIRRARYRHAVRRASLR